MWLFSLVLTGKVSASLCARREKERPASEGGPYKITNHKSHVTRHDSRDVLAGAGDDQRQVIGLLTGAVFLDGVLDSGDEASGRQGEACAHRFDQPRLAELFPRSISGLGDAIGVNLQKVAGRESDAPGDALPFGKQADHRGRGREPFERAVGAEEQRGVVTAIGVNAGAKIDRVTP